MQRKFGVWRHGVQDVSAARGGAGEGGGRGGWGAAGASGGDLF